MPALTMVATTEFSGGAEIYISRMAEGLAGGGVSVALLGALRTWPKALRQEPLGAGPKWNVRRIIGGAIHLPWELRLLCRRVDAAEPDSVYNLHFKREQIGYTASIARLRRKVIWTEHGAFPKGIFGAIVGIPYRMASRKTSLIICVSAAVAADIRKHVAHGTSIVTVPTGIDTDYYDVASAEDRTAARQTLGIPSNALTVGIVGRLTKSKRPELAIAAAMKAGAHVVVAGDGPLRQEIAKRWAGVAEVHVIGHVIDTRTVFDALDVHMFCSNGTGEGMPVTLLEASASGVPTVGTVDSGVGQAIQDAGGALASADADALADWLRPGQMAYLDSARSREWALQFTLARWFAEYARAAGV